ncbi:Oidioi.mRNA.OKI2018_I69.XSR.g16095.t1.cds [Oikopleura dioica]|uniref:Oidioi.mRNA.OKI2018_I69.XSR.g16095.t1.cds n=1 Tax=Oikopleura dioica TaxID=34765 RepID=A0ABN7SPB2_OIKDI|nr:Oidioi.mRNA.OKI2018_I69.XSR.g16095.t1.cds [Oikopleura dioica]
MTITIPTSEEKALKLKFEEITNLESNYQAKNFLVEFDGNTFGEKNQTIPIVTPWDKVSNFTFSYTCNKSKLKNVQGTTTTTLAFGPYQVQYGAAMESKAQPYFSRAIDCTPVFGEMVWITVIAMVVFTIILAFGLYFVVSIEVPSRFESTRSKPLIIPDN